MKKLDKILESITILNDLEIPKLSVKGLTIDSRKAKDDYLFFAYKGTLSDGHDYIQKAVNNGASVVVLDNPDYIDREDCIYILVENARKAVNIIAQSYYDHPSSKLTLVGITGTNGKTTIASMLYDVFSDLGYNCGLISTISIKYDDQSHEAELTTPDALSLQNLFNMMYEKDVTHVFMEVSSHALDQGRIDCIDFDVAVFTNITHDHLDYHHSFDSYIKAKKMLFDNLDKEAFALTNIDDKNGTVMTQNCNANVKSYSLRKLSDFKGKIISNEISGLQMQIDSTEVYLKLIGEFNAYNILAVFGVSMILGIDKQAVLTALSNIDSAEGRMDVMSSVNYNYSAVVDYAHTPDALKNVLETLVKVKQKNARIITVVGCGGNRDKTKRPKMAAIASRLSGLVILTSDNPRDESPDVIISDMLLGLKGTSQDHVLEIVDRKEAIKVACKMAREGDLILVAGKGHEKYQEIKGQRIPFNDKQILSAFMHE